MIFEGLHAIYYNHFDLPRARARAHTHTHTHTHTLRKFVYTKVLVSAGPCSKCRAGDAAGGGVPLDSNGRCAFFCSPKGYCGKSQAQWAKEGKQFSNAYGVGTDCSAPGDRTHTHAPNTHGRTDTWTLNTQHQPLPPHSHHAQGNHSRRQSNHAQGTGSFR